MPSPNSGITFKDQCNAAGLHGAVLVARRAAPPQSEATDLSNVIPFARPRRRGTAAPFPLPSVAADERPAPVAGKFGVGRGLALIVGSLALHSVLLAMAWHEPRPMASIGIQVMTVEITLGATTPAGLAQTPGEQEAQPAPGSEERAQDEPALEQPSSVATAMPQEVPVAPQETAPEVTPQETPTEVATIDPKPQEQQPETAVAETAAETKSTERTEPPRPTVQALQQAPERKRIEAPTTNKATPKKQAAAAAATSAASGVGRGRSDQTSNYNGMVAAHLLRHNPVAARRADAQGAATVSFSIDAGGRVTSSRLTSSSGNAAVDREVLAMPRRASPFPPPPDGKAHNFTVPVRFNLR